VEKNDIKITLTLSILMCYSIKCVYCYENDLKELTRHW